MPKKKSPYNILKLKTLLKAIRAGLSKVGLTSLTVLNKAYTSMADLDKDLAAYQTLFDNVDNLRQQAAVAEEQLQAQLPTIAPFLSALVKAFKAALGRYSATLETVGIKPDKVPAALSLDQKAERVAKNLATREVRHTMGEKAKAKLHGQVPAGGEAAPAGTTPTAGTAPTTGTTGAGTPPAGH